MQVSTLPHVDETATSLFMLHIESGEDKLRQDPSHQLVIQQPHDLYCSQRYVALDQVLHLVELEARTAKSWQIGVSGVRKART